MTRHLTKIFAACAAVCGIIALIMFSKLGMVANSDIGRTFEIIDEYVKEHDVGKGTTVLGLFALIPSENEGFGLKLTQMAFGYKVNEQAVLSFSLWLFMIFILLIGIGLLLIVKIMLSFKKDYEIKHPEKKKAKTKSKRAKTGEYEYAILGVFLIGAGITFLFVINLIFPTNDTSSWKQLGIDLQLLRKLYHNGEGTIGAAICCFVSAVFCFAAQFTYSKIDKKYYS